MGATEGQVDARRPPRAALLPLAPLGPLGPLVPLGAEATGLGLPLDRIAMFAHY